MSRTFSNCIFGFTLSLPGLRKRSSSCSCSLTSFFCLDHLMACSGKETSEEQVPRIKGVHQSTMHKSEKEKRIKKTVFPSYTYVYTVASTVLRWIFVSWSPNGKVNSIHLRDMLHNLTSSNSSSCFPLVSSRKPGPLPSQDRLCPTAPGGDPNTDL